MSVRQLADYGGQDHVGTIFEYAEKSCIARDASGKKLGKFPNFQKAADAVSEADSVFGQARKPA